MPREKIANRQLLFILFMMRTTIVISFLPVLTSADALQDGWLAAILAFFGGAAFIFIIGGLGIRFPQDTIVSYGTKILGKWPAKLIGLVLVWAFLVIAATDTRLYAEAIVSGYLPDTPVEFLIVSMMALSVLAAYAGIEVIGRCADVLFPLFTASVLFSLFAALPQISLSELQPVFARGFGPVLRGAIVPSIITAQYLSLTVLTPHTNAPKKALGTALWALAASSVILVMAAAGAVAILGPSRASRVTFPFFVMVRATQLSEFLERLEVLVTVAWGFGLFVGVSVFLFCSARLLAEVLNVSSYRLLLGPMLVLWSSFSLHAYRDVFQVYAFFKPSVAGPFAASLILLPMGLLWIGYAISATRRKKQ